MDPQTGVAANTHQILVYQISHPFAPQVPNHFNLGEKYTDRGLVAALGWLLYKLSLQEEEESPDNPAPGPTPSQHPTGPAQWLLLHSTSPSLVASILTLMHARFSISMALWGAPDLQEAATNIQAQVQMQETAMPINWCEVHFRAQQLLPLFGRLPVQTTDVAEDSPEEVEATTSAQDPAAQPPPKKARKSRAAKAQAPPASEPAPVPAPADPSGSSGGPLWRSASSAPQPSQSSPAPASDPPAPKAAPPKTLVQSDLHRRLMKQSGLSKPGKRGKH